MQGAGRTVRRVLAVLVLAGGLGLVPRAQADVDPNAYTTTQTYIPSAGGVKLHTVVFRPARASPIDKTPVILVVSPYATSGATPLNPEFVNDPTPTPGGFPMRARVFEHGYSFVEVALRGYGASTGCYDEGGPGEQQDVKNAVEWAASQPWSTGKVGMIGHSYDGQTQLMALATHPKGLAAVVPSSAPAGYVNFFSDSVGNVSGQAFGAFYLASDLFPPSVLAPPDQLVDALTETIDPTCHAATLIGTLDNRPDADYWKARDLAAMAAGSAVPVLMEQGFEDFNVRSTNFSATWPGLAGPKRALLGPWDHDLQPIGGGLTDETLRWLDAYVKGDPAALAYEQTAPRVMVQDVDGRYRAEASWPPADTVGRTFPILGGTYFDGPGNAAETQLPSVVTDALQLESTPVDLPTGIGSWSISAPLAAEVHLAGQATVDVRTVPLISDTTIVTLLYDIDQDGVARFIARGAHLSRTIGNQVVHVTMYPNDWVVAAGHRVGLLLTGSDSVWFVPGPNGAPVRVLGGTLTIPAVATPRTTFLAGGPYRVLARSKPFTVPAEVIARRTTP